MAAPAQPPPPRIGVDDASARQLWVAICPQLYDYIRENTGLDGVPGELAWLPEGPVATSDDAPARKHQLQFLLNPPTVAADGGAPDDDASNLVAVTTMLPRASTDVDASLGIRQREYGNLRPDWMLAASQIHPTAKAPILTKAVRHPLLDSSPRWACSFLFQSDVVVMGAPASSSCSSSSSSSSSVAAFADREVDRATAVRLTGGHAPDTAVTGLSWNCKEPDQLLSAGHDGRVLLWRIERSSHPVSAWRQQQTPWHTVEWNPSSAFQFAAGGERRFCVWDTRLDAAKDGPTHEHVFEGASGANAAAVMTLAFNPSGTSTLLATGGRDHPVTVWDLRNLRAPLCAFADAHVLDADASSLDRCGASRDLVTHVAWCPHDDTILGSSGAPNRVCIFDVARARDFAERGILATESDADDDDEEEEEEQAAGNREAGDTTATPATKSDLAHYPGRVFTHEGHQSVATSFAWNPDEEWTIASCERRGHLQIWQISSEIAYAEEEEEEEAEGEEDATMQASDDVGAA